MNTHVNYLQTNQYDKLPMYVAFHTHKSHELMYYYHGEGMVACGGVSYPYTSGTILIIPPESPHDETHFSATDVTFIEFSLDDSMLIQEPLMINDLKMEGQILTLCKEWSSSEIYAEEKRDACLLELLVELLRKKDSLNKNHEHLSNTLLDIHANNGFGNIGYSYDHFRHTFKKQMGISPHQFLIKSRVTKAQYLLKYTTLPITEIAIQCNFSSSSYFSERFKKITGFTPREYRGQE